MSTTVQYKGNTLTTVSNATKTLKTAGKYMEGDVSITDNSGSGQGNVWQDAEGYLHLDDESEILLQTKNATPSETAQTIKPDAGYYALDKVNVSAISSTYVGSGITRRSSSDLTASGATVSVPSGYYASNASKAVSSGSATTPATTVTANPSISVNSSGLITATASATKSVTPIVSAGYVSSGTAGTITVSGSNTSQLSTQAGKTVTPTESEQTAVTSGKYTTGAVKVGAISSTYVGSGITQRDSDDLTISGATVTAPSGYYSASASKSVASGSAGTPTATKGTVSNHSVTVTPSVTNTTGYITGGTINGTGVSVSASELVSGNKSITANGTNIDVANYSTVSVAIESATGDYMAKATKSGTATFTIQIGSGSRTNITDGAKYFFNSGDTITVRVVDGGSVYYNGMQVASNVQSTVSYSFTAPSNHLNIACSSDRIDINVTLVPSGTKSITANGTGIDVTDYASVDVAVSGGGGDTWTWMGKNPTKLGTILSEKVYLKNTNYATWTPSTTAATIVASRTLNVTLSYEYDYIVTLKYHAHFEYDSTATNTGRASDYYASYSNSYILYGNTYDDVAAGTKNKAFYNSIGGRFMLLYKNASGNDSYTSSASYNYSVYIPTSYGGGIKTSSSDSFIINVTAPTISAKCAASYFSTTNAAAVDQDKSYYEMVIEYYKVDNGTTPQGSAVDDVRNMWLNGDII